MNEEHFIPREAAGYLRTAPATLANWRVRGIGPTFTKCGGRVLYLKRDLDAFLEANRRRSTSERPEAA